MLVVRANIGVVRLGLGILVLAVGVCKRTAMSPTRRRPARYSVVAADRFEVAVDRTCADWRFPYFLAGYSFSSLGETGARSP
jgi:hypothetical protein